MTDEEIKKMHKEGVCLHDCPLCEAEENKRAKKGYEPDPPDDDLLNDEREDSWLRNEEDEE